MNIFIAGGHGFIGRHLVEKLNLFDKYKLFIPNRRELNLLNEVDIDRYILKVKPDIIINCANIGGDFLIGNENILEDNLRIFFNIAKHAGSVNKIINIGSGAEYSKNHPIVAVKEEEANLQIPLDEYGFYKSIISKYIQQSNNIYNLRVFGAYGEYENYRFKFITNAIVRNLLEMPIVINQNVLFDYIYIDDLVRIIQYFIDNYVNTRIFNVTTGEKIDLITLSQLINTCSQYQSDIIVRSCGLNDEYTSNNEKLLTELKTFKFTSHRTAIKKIQKYFKENLSSIDTETIKNDLNISRSHSIWKK